MTCNKNHALFLAAALVLGAAFLLSFASATGAQSSPASGPIVKARFEVLHMLYQSIQVRSLADMRELHTFTYSPAIRDKMQNVFNAGGYQYGDKVVVWYRRGEDVAIKIAGKPSKPH